MNSSNSAEREPRKGKLVSRRTVLKGAAAVGGTVAISAGLGLPALGFIRADRGRPSRPEAELSHEDLISRLFENINRSVGDQEAKTKATELAKELQKIVNVNDRFVNAYRRDIYIDGKRTEPRLASLYRKKYASFQIEDPESMIWIVNNNLLAESLIIDPLKDLVEAKGGANVLDSLSEIKRRVDEDKTSEGEQKFVWGSHIRLRDYGQVDTQKGGSLQIGAGSEIRTEEGRKELAKDIENVKNILANTPRVGDADIRLWSESRYGKENKYTGRGAGSFGEGTFLSKVNLGDAVSAFLIYHEVAGHGLDIVHNDTQLFRYLSPEAIYKLLALREEALSDKDWGRTYPDIERTFGKRTAIIPPKVPRELSSIRILPPGRQEEGPLKVSSFRESSDDYPDGIFCTGFYIDAPISGGATIQRKADQGILNAYQGIFESQNTTSWTLQEFLDKPDNLVLFRVITQKSPWLGAVMNKLKQMVPILDGRLSWLEVGKVLPIPKAGSRDSEWYEFLTGIGQRLAVAEMFRTRDSALNMLAESEKDHFQGQLLEAHYAADLEMFANMMAVSLNYSSFNFESPSPYLAYIETIRQDLLARGISVEPTRELMAAILHRSPVPLV